ncbi:MAG: hypothetical protein ABI763_13870 [Bacteroidota bacterium]
MKTRVAVLGINIFKYFVGFGVIYLFGLLLAFNIYVKYFGSLGPTEYYSIPVTQVNSGTRSGAPSIGFYFKGRYNTLSGNQFYQILKTSKDRFNPNCNLNFECRKTIFNSYLVDSYSIR